MRRLNHYIGKTVVAATFVVLLVVLSLTTIFAYLDQLADLKGSYDQWQAVIYVLLTLPGAIYENLPFVVLIGCLIGLGILASGSELVVMRAAGISVRRIAWSVLRAMSLYIILGLTLGEYVTPVTDQLAESRKALAQGRQNPFESTTGYWNREKNEFRHINVVLPNGVLYGVSRYGFNEQQELEWISYAERATYSDGKWLEEEGVVSHFSTSDSADDKITKEAFTLKVWETELSPKVLNVLVLPPEGLPMSSLFQYATYLDKQERQSANYWLSFWQKALQPLSTISLIFVAISFVFGPLRQVSMGFRIFSGVVVGITFSTSQNLLGPASVIFGFSPLLSVLLPIALCMAFGLYLIKRAG